jgi:hypothetical protein
MKHALRVLLAAVLLLSGVFLVRYVQERQAARPHLAFANLSIDSVSSLHIEYLGQAVTIKNVGGAWVTSGDEFPADTARLFKVLGHVMALQTQETVAHDEAGNTVDLNLAEYGLDSASARHVTLRLFDGRTYRVALGKVSGIDFGSSFWRPYDRAVVYRTPGTFVFEVSSRTQDWKDTTLYAPIVPDDIRSLAVTWREGPTTMHRYTVERGAETAGQETFVLSTPEQGPHSADREQAHKLFLHATQFKIDGFVPGVDSSAVYAGLEKPVMTLRITLKSGAVRLIEAGAPVDGLYRYIRHPTHKDPVRVFGWRFEYFRKKGPELVGL